MRHLSFDNLPPEEKVEDGCSTLLRFLTCGSVDDGKSTLIGRLLYETGSLYEDQLQVLKNDSNRFGKSDGELDYSLLLDGLDAEREQGITIDVAYRYFSSERRSFIVADTPGHEEYTRNMATGASTADLAVVLVDAQCGFKLQTNRHISIAALLKIPHIIFAINKMDAVDFDESTYASIAGECHSFADQLGFMSISSVPLSARFGDNVTRSSPKTPWYHGKSLLGQLETVPVLLNDHEKPFRLPVQLIARAHDGFRGVSGQVAAGVICTGDEIVVSNSGIKTSVKHIITPQGYESKAVAGDAVTLVLNDEVDVSRGSILASPLNPPKVSDQFQAHVIWFGRTQLITGRNYHLRTETDMVSATVVELSHQVDVHSLARESTTSLHTNDVGICTILTQRPIAFDNYNQNRSTGNFLLLDRFTHETVGVGLIDLPVKRGVNVTWQTTTVTKESRAQIKFQRPYVLWFTGLSGSGKSTVANQLEILLHNYGKHTCLLDGDNLRHGLNKDLGFSAVDRVENVRRLAETAKLMVDAGLIVLVASISPFAAERHFARELFQSGEFFEVFVDTPLDECVRRDPKGLYKKAAAGEIMNFTGITSPYETPSNPDIKICTVDKSPLDVAMEIFNYVCEREI